jgi:S1-C subfamily serine protease
VKLVLAAALALTLAVAPARAPDIVTVRVGDDVARGFVVGDGRVVTVAHVLGPDLRVDGRRATIVRRDDRLDLALLSVPGVHGDAPRIARDDARIIRRADASLDGSTWRRPVLELRTTVAPGDSGTPVLTAAGQVIGIVFARSRRGTAWALDASDQAVAEFLTPTNS